jgi:GDP-L-fucose synthase
MSPPSAQFELLHKRIYVAGHTGMVGSAIVRRLGSEGCEVLTPKRLDLDLRHGEQVDRWMAEAKPDAVFLAAGKVGGIHANSTYPADFIADNLAIALNVIRSAYESGVRKLLFLGSSCIFPRLAPQPMTEEMLLTGPLEPTNQWYAIAKIAGIKLCEAYRLQHGADFISVMPTNLYGPGDNYHPQDSHVPAALISRFHAAKVAGEPHVSVWGTGTPRREFLAVDDLADASVFVMKNYSDVDFVNVGSGEEITIADFARLVAEVVGYESVSIYRNSLR